MLTELAKQDLAALRQSGFNPTDEEVVELNDAAVRIERGKDTTCVNHPRVGFAGNTIIHEPTIGGLMWFEQYGKNATNNQDIRFNIYLFMCANCTDNLDYLNELQKPSKIIKEVLKWMGKINTTTEDLWRALIWVKFGNDDCNIQEAQRVQKDLNDDEFMDACWKSIVTISGNTGISMDELKTKTKSVLDALYVQYNKHAGIPVKKSIVDDYITYKKIIKKIEKRCTKDLENGSKA